MRSLLSVMSTEQPFNSFRPQFQFYDDEFFTFSSTEQKRVEDLVSQELEYFAPNSADENWKIPVLQRQRHIDYIMKDIFKGPMCLDASRPWMCYWGVHALNLLGHPLTHDFKDTLIKFLKTCEASEGGYGGGPGQMPHLAPTYAAVLTLVSLRSEEALASINREKLRDFLRSLHQPDGSFIMHRGGETDIRGAYCALAVGTITRVLDETITANTAEWIVSCQTYEGGFGGEPGAEAHGGYTFCALGALSILGKGKLVDLDALLKWLCNKQMKFEGGFCGRTNKLVDACYSFWQAAVFRLIDVELQKEGRAPLGGAFDSRSLQEYILVACQDVVGGLRDKPEKHRDLYHTCYALSGLSVAQSYCESKSDILGGEASAVHSTHPVLNVLPICEEFATNYFEKLGVLP